jgi:hypothetical protein
MGIKNLLKLIKLLFIIIVLANCKSSTPTYEVTEVKAHPVIDGQIDDVWNKAKIEIINKSIIGSINRKDERDFNVNFRSLWDNTNLYFLFVVMDDVKLYYPEIPWYENDLVQIFIGRNLKKMKASKNHSLDILQYSFIYNVDSLLLNGKYILKTNIEFKRTNTFYGYILEIKLPWNEIGINPIKNLDIPVNFEASDLDRRESENGIIGIKETVIGWAPNTADHSWAQTKSYGDLILF